ncbi:RNA polymerase sigma factor [Flagellimonas flava]|nr:sigma-70 family RNA polymerase sigma factor [Allomuricauda flava]
MDQNKIWSKFKTGDKKAFESVYKLCIDDMYAYGLKLNPNKELVKDCIQQVFVDVYEHRNGISDPKNIKFYILKALKHAIYKRQKRENKKSHLEELSELEFRTAYNFEDKRIISEIDEQKQLLVKKALGSLSSKQREIMYLRFTLGLDYNEISDMAGIDHSSVRKQVYRSIKKLRSSEVFDDYKSIILFYSTLPFFN